MPIVPPALDDRSFDDLVEEVIARIPAHTPEWTNPRPGDPGRTLVELFAWLTDTLLYRANLIPERQRLVFLRLLGIPLKPAVPARGLIALSIDDDQATRPIYLQPLATAKGPVSFETLAGVTVLPVTAEAYYKRPLTDDESSQLADLIPGLQQVYGLPSAPRPYVTTPIFAGGTPEPAGFDLVTRTVDGCLWLALLAAKKEIVDDVRQALGTNPLGASQIISIGVAPPIQPPTTPDDPLAASGPPTPLQHVWEITTGQDDAPYRKLDPFADTTGGLTQRGVLQLQLPDPSHIGAPSNDVRVLTAAGVGDRPPRLDSAGKADRLVAWIRLRPQQRVQSLAVSWVGINAVEIDQRQTIVGRLVGQGNGAADQQLALPGQSVDPETLQLQVEAPGQGYQLWQPIDDLGAAAPNALVYTLDSEAGTIRFGNRLQGAVPEPGARVRVALMRVGGGQAGNLPPGSLTDVAGVDETGAPASKLKALQSLPTDGGQDAETLPDAEHRIPALFRHQNRAVTADDYRQLAAETPGVQLGRVEILPSFLPAQRRSSVPGVVSVMVLPRQATLSPPNPRADQPILGSVHAYLDARRPLATELYVIGCEYVPLGVSVGIALSDALGLSASLNGSSGASANGAGPSATADGARRDAVLRAIRDALRLFLWPLSPGGTDGTGWTLGRAVRDRELEVVVARVSGVDEVTGINLFQPGANGWTRLSATSGQAILSLQPWQLPELLQVVVAVGDDAPTDLGDAPNPYDDAASLSVPVVPDACR